MTSQPTPTAEDLQLAQELIAQLQDPEWTLAAAQLEDEVGGEVGTGYVKDHQLGKFLSDPAGFCQHQRLRTLVFQGLRQMLVDCDLGAGLPAAYSKGKKLLDERLQQPSIEIQQQLMAILSEDISSSRDVPLPETAKSSLKQVIRTVLSPEDWEAIVTAAANSLQQYVREVIMLPQAADATA